MISRFSLGAPLALALLTLTGLAEDRNWKASYTGDWSTVAGWVEGTVPEAGDNVYITNLNGSVLLTNSTPALGSLTLSRTLTVTNWNTVLAVAGDVVIRTNGLLTTPVVGYRSTQTNRIYLTCSNLTLEPGGRIFLDARGYGGGWAADGLSTSDSPGTGPGGQVLGAASYGGRGGDEFETATAYRCGSPYGTAHAPTGPGSGGGSFDGRATYLGGNGGGSLRIEAEGHVLVNGTITANSGPGTSKSCPGSGGAVWITCRTLGGTNGIIRAQGLDGTQGGGGGGRIAIDYDPVEQAALPLPVLALSTKGGLTTGTGLIRHADIGTLYLTDSLLLPPVVTWSGQLFFRDTPTLFNSLLVSNGWIRFPEGDYTFTITNDLVIMGASGRVDVAGNRYYTSSGLWRLSNASNAPCNLTVNGNLMLTNGGILNMVASPTNGTAGPYGSLLTVGGRLAIGTNSWLVLTSNPTNGGSPRVACGDLEIQPRGGIDANASGFAGGRNSAGLGYGGGRYCGGSHGGRGGAYDAANPGRSGTYGASNAFIHCGSGAGGGDTSSRYQNSAGHGGGLIRITAANSMTLNGTISAMGGGAGTNYSSAGSGGGIYLECLRLAGDNTNAIIRATGGSVINNGASGGGGGGGRIYVKRIPARDSYAGLYNVSGGTGKYMDGETGTVCIVNAPLPGGAVMLVR